MDGVNEFLKSSTIHGLVYISTARSTLIKCFWFVVVLLGFIASVFLINEAFLDWNESPIGTSEETLPIDNILFPKITVCPPKGTHTGLNQHLVMSTGVSLKESEEKKVIELSRKLVEERESWEIMIDNLQFKELNKFKNWYDGKSSVAFQFETIQGPLTAIDTLDFGNFEDPEWHYAQNYFLKTYATSGSVQTPWFGKSFDEETFLPAFRTM